MGRLANILKACIRLFPLQRKMVFECQSDMDDNPRAVYEYMLSQNIHERYKMVWLVRNVEFCKMHYACKNTEFINPEDHSIRNTLRLWYHCSTARCFIFSHPWWFKKEKKKQVVVHIGHGTPLKGSVAATEFSKIVDKLLVTTEDMRSNYLRFWKCTDEQAFLCGNPRNDFLFKGQPDDIFPKLFDYRAGDRVIMCMPTYRQTVKQTDSENIDAYSLGVIKTKDEFTALNETLRQHNIHLLIKLHPLQVLDSQELSGASHIHYIVNKELFEKEILLYELLGCCDALLTDISSVFFDYLVLDRPIGFFVNDFQKYSRGYLIDDPFSLMPGQKIYSQNDLFEFVQNYIDGHDDYQEDRNRVNRMVNPSVKPDNCQSFVRYLEEWLGERF